MSPCQCEAGIQGVQDADREGDGLEWKIGAGEHCVNEGHGGLGQGCRSGDQICEMDGWP